MLDSRKPELPRSYICFSALQTVLQSLNGCCTNSHRSAFPLLIKECAQISCLSMANWFFSLVVFAGLDRCVELRNNLVGVYGRCHSYEDAHALFHGIIHKDVMSWNAIMGTCIDHGLNLEVFFLFTKMINRDKKPNKITFLRLLVAASNNVRMSEMMVLHSYLAECNYVSDLFVCNALLNLYSKHGSLQDLEKLFSLMLIRDVFSWTIMIGAHAKLNNSRKAIETFEEMQGSGVAPNAITYINLLKVFHGLTALAEGKAIHALIQNDGLETDPVIGNSLISMYGRCSCLEDAVIVFNKMHKHDVVSWNAIIAACAQQGCHKDAIEIFRASLSKGLRPNNVTFVSILDAYAGEKLLEEGRLIHSMISENGIKLDIVLETALLNMYGKCGNVIDARCIFEKMSERNVVSWTAILTALSEHGYITEALEFFSRMMISKIVKPNNVTFVAILDACTIPEFQAEGRLIHCAIVSCYQCMDITVGNALLNMYNNCGQLDDAVALFNRLPNRDVVAWTSMICAHSQHDHGKEAIFCFAKMLESGISPNNITFISLLNVCAALSDLAVGKLLHNFIIEIGFVLDCDIETALVDMYGKCGSLQEAHVIFLNFNEQDVVSWNVILSAYAQQGYGKQTLELYFAMEEGNLQPNAFTFISLINACSHAGLVDLGRHYFDCMKPKYGITPTIEHYICMIDLLGRAGRLEEAENFIKDMPIPPTAMVWMSYLSACKLHNNLDKGRLAAENAQRLEPKNLSVYVVLSNIYAAVERQGAL